jgi:hypothetical protein
MRKEVLHRNVLVLTVALLFLVLAAWWGYALTPAGAQTSDDPPVVSSTPVPTPPPFFNVTMPDEPVNKTVVGEYGTYTFRTLGPDKSILRPTGGASGATGSSSRSATLSQTSVTNDYVDNITGHIGFIPRRLGGGTAPDGTFTTIERKAIPRGVNYPREVPAYGGWQVVKEHHLYGTEFFDFDLIIGTTYDYKYSHFFPGKIFGTAAQTADYGIHTPEFLYARGHADGVQVFLRRDEDDSSPQYATITRYDHIERRPGTGVVLCTKERITGEFVDFVDDKEIDTGTIYYYEMDLFYRPNPSSPYRMSGFIVPPVATYAGIPTVTRPNKPVINDDASRERSYISFTLPSTYNRAALGWIVEAQFASDGAWMPVGSTTQRLIFYHSDADTVSDNRIRHRVSPITMDKQTSATASFIGYGADANPLTCATGALATQPIIDVTMYKDILGNAEAGTQVPRTFDVYPAGLFGVPCLLYSMDALHLKRAFYYKHVLDDTCTPSTESCNVIDEDPDDMADLTVEVVENAVVERWGFPQWQVASLSDRLLPAGRYGILYQACFIKMSTPVREECSNWVDTGLHYVGVTAEGFSTAPPVTSDIRTYPDAFVHHRFR